MQDALKAVEVALIYAHDQMQWYEESAFEKLVLFRVFGVAALTSSILVTYFSATLSEANTNFLGLKRKNITAFLAALATISVAVSGFFGWKSAWEGHRTAQLTIEAIIVDHKLQQLRIQGDDSKADEMHKLAETLTNNVKNVVLKETAGFFGALKGAQLNPDGSLKPKK